MKRVRDFGLLVLIMMIFQVFEAKADIILPSIFGNNMVLQQNSNVALWGKAAPNTAIRIKTSWNNKTYSTRSGGDGSWMIKVYTPQAGGPFTLTLSDGKPLVLRNILIGEVWVCSGQSNMFMPLSGFKNQPVQGSLEFIVTSANPQIRLLTVPPKASLTPENDFEGKWEECNPESVNSFSATAYFFGKMLNQVLGVPIGLIQTSWGGTRIESWMSDEGARKFEWIKIPGELPQSKTISKDLPTVIYNAMINPLVGFGIRGVIWYQGEANRNEPERYRELLSGLVADWRSEWDSGDFPFYYVQIAPYHYGKGINSAYIREAQLQASSVILNSGMVSLMDVGEENCNHPASKKVGGDRLAYMALSKTYDIMGFPCEGPTLKEMKVAGTETRLTFNNAPNGLTSFGKELKCFELAGPDRIFYPARAVITPAGITLTSSSVNEPIAVRYAFMDFVVGDLFNTEGLPASSFRTDTWPEDLAIKSKQQSD